MEAESSSFQHTHTTLRRGRGLIELEPPGGSDWTVKFLSRQQAGGPLSTSQGNKQFPSPRELHALQQSHLPETSLLVPRSNKTFTYLLSSEIASLGGAEQAGGIFLCGSKVWLWPYSYGGLGKKSHWKYKVKRVGTGLCGGMTLDGSCQGQLQGGDNSQ